MEPRPATADGLRVAATDDGCIVHDPAVPAVHLLNRTAAILMVLCDGRRTGAEIQHLVDELSGQPIEPRGVTDWLAQAEKDGLIVFGGERPGPLHEMDAAELVTLAARIADDGETDKALVCQKKAAELLPDDPAILRELAELAQIEGERDVARSALRRYRSLVKADPEVDHLLRAMGDRPPPDKAPDAFIRHLYRRFAEYYDFNMLDELDYKAPGLLIDAVVRHLPRGTDSLRVLELGCGTGLVGPLLRPLARFLEGIDLSPEMLEQARKRDAYDALHVADLTRWLEGEGEPYDLVIACDVLIYFGELAPVFQAVANRLSRAGCFGLTLEKSPAEDGWILTDSGRYAHGLRHIERLAAHAGLRRLEVREVELRKEYDEPVTGLVLLFGR